MTAIKNEIWVTIPWVPHLEISSHGNVRIKATGAPKSLRPWGKGQYLAFEIRKTRRGKRRKDGTKLVKKRQRGFRQRVHRAVALLFVPNDLPLIHNQINHIDGNKYNNHASNLE